MIPSTSPSAIMRIMSTELLPESDHAPLLFGSERGTRFMKFRRVKIRRTRVTGITAQANLYDTFMNTLKEYGKSPVIIM
jgi:hypothetical protein